MYLLLAVLLYAMAMKHSADGQAQTKLAATQQSTNYTAEGGASLRGSTPSVSFSPAREHHEEDVSTPNVTHPDDVARVHKALQIAKTRQQLDDPTVRALIRHIESTGQSLASWHE